MVLIALGIVLILMVSCRLYLEYRMNMQLFLNFRASKKELLAHIRSHDFSASLLLIVLIAVICAVPGIPTSVISVITGLNFGSFTGADINVLGSALSNISVVLLMHRLKFLGERTEKNHWVQSIRQMRHPKVDVILGYIIPMISPFMANFAADAMKLSLQQAVMSIAIGVISSSVLYACRGEALFHGHNKTAITLVASVTVLVGLVIFIYRNRKKKQGKRRQK